MDMYMKTCLFGLRLKSGGQHLREELEEDGEKELHERNNDEHHEGHETKQVSTGPHQLKTKKNNSALVIEKKVLTWEGSIYIHLKKPKCGSLWHVLCLGH